MLTIRAEIPEDIPAIHHINAAAFGQVNEADLVDALRRNGGLTIALVAIQDDHIVGHIAFSPVTITSDAATIAALGLAPMAVLPAYQRRGIGSQLVEAGLTACHHTPYGVVVVLGHPHYYPRFGFTPAKPLGIVWEPDAPDEAFMVQEVREGALTQMKGVVKYRPEFQAVSPQEEAIMPAQHDSLALLQTPVAHALLHSTIPARLAYTGRDGTPRVLPIWFYWTGEVFVLGTRLDSGKVKALSTYPTVALTIDTESFPYQALQVRGTIAIETIEGIVPEYELCAKRYLGEQRGQAWMAQLRQAFPPMARIVVRPEWVGVLDLAQLYPQVIAAVMAAE